MAQSTLPVPSLRRWGASPDADLLYRALVLVGPRTSAQAARELGVAEARVLRALDELVALRAVRPSTQPPTGLPGRVWAATPTDRVAAALRRPPATGGGPDERWRRYLLATAAIDLATAAPGSVQRLATRALARSRIAELMAAERHEHLAINTEQVISADTVRAALPLDRSARARGIQMRMIGLPTAEDHYLACVDPGEAARLEGDYREADTPPLKLMVFDRRAALFPVDPVDFDAGAVVVTDPAAVDHLTRLFYRCWAAASDPSRRGVPPTVLTPRERALIELLSAGHSEQSAAEQMRVSRRTVVYMLRVIMDRLQVENRFQLALVLGGTRAVPLPTPYDDIQSYPRDPDRPGRAPSE